MFILSIFKFSNFISFQSSFTFKFILEPKLSGSGSGMIFSGSGSGSSILLTWLLPAPSPALVMAVVAQAVLLHPLLGPPFLHPWSYTQLKALPLGEGHILCDISIGAARPVISVSYHKAVFDSIQNLTHPGTCAT
jgi:hypothetical protein